MFYLKGKNSGEIESKVLQSVSYRDYYKHFNGRYSKPYDQFYYAKLKENQKYKYEQIDSSTGILSVYTFAMGK
jgi:hypothetical protein